MFTLQLIFAQVEHTQKTLKSVPALFLIRALQGVFTWTDDRLSYTTWLPRRTTYSVNACGFHGLMALCRSCLAGAESSIKGEMHSKLKSHPAVQLTASQLGLFPFAQEFRY